MGLIIGGGNTKSGGGGGDVRLETNHSATIETNGTHVVTPTEGYDGMRKATINVDVQSEGTAADKALAANATQYGLSHNLYAVMEDVKKDPRTSGYAAIMLCRYYKGYNSLSLEGGADAFLTSDGDFYQGNAVHYWHDANDTMFDHWVAMLFSSESGNYTCSNASICPKAALIDGTMGDINLTATNMRFAWIDVTEGSSFGQVYISGSHTCNWDRNLTLRGARNIQKGNTSYFIALGNVEKAIIGVKEINGGFLGGGNAITHIECEGLVRIGAGFSCILQSNSTILEIVAKDLEIASKLFYVGNSSTTTCTTIRRIVMPQLKSLNYLCGSGSAASTGSGFASLIHFEIGQGFYSNLNLRMCTFANCLLTDTNDLVEDVTAHPTWSNLDQWLYNIEHLIVDKLADLSGQTAKTITLAAAPYAAITNEIRSKMSAKNWNLASA